MPDVRRRPPLGQPPIRMTRFTSDQIGCCGACCATCRAFQKPCRGCKLGYNTADRDPGRIRCAVKKCCLSKAHVTCADCAAFLTCTVLSAFHTKASPKYAKYRQALSYIRANGYRAFIRIAASWSNAYGKYPS